MKFKANDSREELDRLISNMNELQIKNMLSILDIYITVRSLSEIETRMIDVNNGDTNHEQKMRGVLDFRNMLGELIKTT